MLVHFLLIAALLAVYIRAASYFGKLLSSASREAERQIVRDVFDGRKA